MSVMARNEVAARSQGARYSYIATERSTRTGGHLWEEKVVETDDGPLRRLLAIDGKQLSPVQAKEEDARIEAIVSNPSAFRRENASHHDDELRATQLLQLLPNAFIISPNGTEGNCVRFTFRPNPQFQPSSYEERAIHAMGGTVSLSEPMDRLCVLKAKILSPVEFGYGFLGKIEAGGSFALERVPIAPTFWKSDRISVHVKGHVLMLKTFTREQEVTRRDIQILVSHPSIAQAANMSKP